MYFGTLDEAVKSPIQRRISTTDIPRSVLKVGNTSLPSATCLPSFALLHELVVDIHMLTQFPPSQPHSIVSDIDDITLLHMVAPQFLTIFVTKKYAKGVFFAELPQNAIGHHHFGRHQHFAGGSYDKLANPNAIPRHVQIFIFDRRKDRTGDVAATRGVTIVNDSRLYATVVQYHLI
uniref:Uncharacterized protein n=1 Tax=Romanomermis culicivorax TaxID=13658 RepID=A0A915JVM7_ROMCU